MTGFSKQWLLTASLVSILAVPVAAFAQTARPWVDPPAESEGKHQVPTASPSPGTPVPQTVPHQTSAPPSQRNVKDSVTAETPPATETSSRNAAADNQIKPKVASERKVRPPSKQAKVSTKGSHREGQVARRRDANTQMSQARPRSAIERRARIARYGTVQEGLDAGLQVMRLRTIQLPDGRRIDVLTRPDQDIASGLPDGY